MSAQTFLLSTPINVEDTVVQRANLLQTLAGRQPVDQLERHRMLDQILMDLLARGSSYGFSLDDILEGLAERKEASL